MLRMVGGWFCARKDNGQKATKSTEPDNLRALGVIRNGITDFISMIYICTKLMHIDSF